MLSNINKSALRKIFIITFSLFLLFPTINSENPEDNTDGEDPIISILKSDETGVLIEIIVPTIEIDDVEVNEETYQILNIPGYSSTLEIGLPQIPVIRKTIAIPSDVHSFSINTIDSSCTDSIGYNIYPFQNPEFDSNNEDFVINEDFYKLNTFYPVSLVFADNISYWRNIEIISIQINPVMYNPNTTELKIFDYILLEINYDSTGFTSKTMSPIFSNLAKNIILNSDSIKIDKTDEKDKSSGFNYLAIVHPPLENAVKPLIDWKHKKGLKSKLVNTSITGITANNIKNYITNFYSSNPDLEYVLLVGDIDDLPWCSFWGVTGSDYWYGDIAGDIYPELAVGRISAVNSAEVTQQINKIISYEKNPPIGDWLNKALLVAHKEGAPGKYEGCSETIRTSPYTDNYDFLTGYGSQGESNTDVNNKINTGIGILNYRGHGAYNCWSDGWTTAHYEGYYNSDVEALINGNFTPIHYCIACNTADLSSSDKCLAEAFIKSENAAVAYLGATEPSWTEPNHDFDQQLFQASGNLGIFNVGWISNYANAQLIDYYGSSSMYMDNVKMYLWLGDPSLELWTDIPDILNVTHPLIITSEMSSLFNVTVQYNGTAMEDAFVCIENGQDFYEIGYTNTTGCIQFDIVNLSSGYLNVTVTKHNYIPYVGSADIPVRIPLEQGWNFVSLPVCRAVEKINLTIWDGNEVILWADAVNNGILNSFIFGWDRVSQSYIFSDVFEPGYGYWVYANIASELWTEDYTSSQVDISTLKKDWNSVGINSNQTINFSDLIVNYNGTDYNWMDAVNLSIINNYVFGWDRTSQSYTFNDKFKPGYCYWFNTLQQCTLKRS